MIYEGQKVYYIEDNQVINSTIIDIEKVNNNILFSLEGYGACEGNFRINDDQIGLWIFFEEDKAIQKKDVLASLG